MQPDSHPAAQGYTFYFVGVTTAQSSIMRVFPRWMEILGRPEVSIAGIDHPIHDTAANYRATVERIKHDPWAVGGLVTTHKLDLYAAAHDLFEYLDPYAQLTHELSSISKQAGRLEGHAKDPLTAGLSLDAIIGPGYFGRTNAAVLCFGAGGSALATLLHLINKPEQADRPQRFVAVNRSAGRLEHMQQLARQLGSDIMIEGVVNSDPLQNDRLLASMPPGTIVINATGMGKDTPGSPISDAAIFPERAVVWEFNYRGALDFLQQARRQRELRSLQLEDGWVYFLHGWSQVIAQVLHIDLTPELFAQLDYAATCLRG
ncbi:MAG: shikimate dehydrogenase [Roseiflexaceae bacterium]